jgi:hypothetical protein
LSRPVFDKATKPTRPIVIHDCRQLELFGSSSENAEAEYQKYTLKLHLSFHIFIWQHFLLELSKCTFTYHLIEYRTSIKGDTLEVRQHSLYLLSVKAGTKPTLSYFHVTEKNRCRSGKWNRSLYDLVRENVRLSCCHSALLRALEETKKGKGKIIWDVASALLLLSSTGACKSEYRP